MGRRRRSRSPLRSALRSVVTYTALASELMMLEEVGADVPCRRPDVNPEWWFAEEERLARKARSLCGECPLRLPCFRHGVEQREFGIWGGIDHKQRAELLGTERVNA